MREYDREAEEAEGAIAEVEADDAPPRHEADRDGRVGAEQSNGARGQGLSATRRGQGAAVEPVEHLDLAARDAGEAREAR